MSGVPSDEGKLDEKDDDESVNSSEEALCEMLGLTSFENVFEEDGVPEETDDLSPLPNFSAETLRSIVRSSGLPALYESQGVCTFPSQFSVPQEYIGRITDELVWGGERAAADRTFESIQVLKNGQIALRRTLTRLENFVDAHPGWSELCHGYLSDLISSVLGTKMVLFKEKLNLKPPGGSGFAPHLDAPSLRVALGGNGPKTFVTVMVAIDAASEKNGCLRVSKGAWSETHHCAVTKPEQGGNPDAAGRAGAIPPEQADSLQFENITCKGGTVSAFNGWVPHRSAANCSPFPRRAVFLTYNPLVEGEFHRSYYEEMLRIRNKWREEVGLVDRERRENDHKLELEALATVPT